MSDKLNISRRDFLNGAALTIGAGSMLSPMDLLAATEAPYPPSLTGLRGSHTGSFEIAHAVARGGQRFDIPGGLTDSEYDLVVVGGGISGLSAALFFQQRTAGGKRVLILDNHDDFGGHATRNEFTVDGRQLIGYGGSQSIDGPAGYSAAAAQLLRDVAIDTNRFYEYFDRDFYKEHGLVSKLFFGADAYGRDQLRDDLFGYFNEEPDLSSLEQIVASYPLSDEGRAGLLRLLNLDDDLLPDLGNQEKIRFLQKISYTDFMQQYGGVEKEVTDIFRDRPRGIWGVGWDALSALEGWRWGNPGMAGLNLQDIDLGWLENGSEEPYIFHFPDGNAGVARSIVRKLIPAAIPGETMEDLVLARVDYDRLDLAGNATRLRLNSTAVDIRNVGGGADVTYVRGGDTYRVRGKHVVYAGYHELLPHICAELPAEQRQAIRKNTKVPLVYVSIAVRNWRAFANVGAHRIVCAQPSLMHSFGLDFPVSMGGYKFTNSVDEATVLHGTYVPALPDQGLDCFEQAKQGRRILYEMSFADFEEKIIGQLDGALRGGGFDVERDIAALTVNRWPHGYAYEYNELRDDPSFTPFNGPHLVARRQLNRISIANSDANAYAYMNSAIDAADRAVDEQLKDAG